MRKEWWQQLCSAMEAVAVPAAISVVSVVVLSFRALAKGNKEGEQGSEGVAG
jgi:hypothetical protein